MGFLPGFTPRRYQRRMPGAGTSVEHSPGANRRSCSTLHFGYLTHTVRPHVALGHSKDHRPDLKQLVFILTVASDGAVPVAYRLADGNTNDDPTHIPTWDQLVGMLGRCDFLYVADAKLCSREAMGHIAHRGGRFITVLPRSRGEDRWFRDWAQTHPPQWTEAERGPGPRLGEPDQVYSTFPAPLPSAEGYRIVWVHSTAKAAADAAARQARIETGSAAIDALATRLAGPKCRLKTRVAVQDEAAAALARAGAERWVSYTIEEAVEETYRQERRGRPGKDTRYHRHTTTRHTISWDVRLDVLAYDAATDGCFPLITNDTTLSDAEVLHAYRYQPNLERRHHLLKSVQDAAPLLLRNPARIEALFCCQFLALLLAALIERQIRAAMTAAATRHIPLYPELRACTAPSTERILEIFADLTRHHLYRDRHLVQTFEPEINPLQHTPTPGSRTARRAHHRLHAPLTHSTRRGGDIGSEKCGTSVQGVPRAGLPDVETHLQMGHMAPQQQAEAVDRRPLLRQAQQVQERPMGVRRPRQQRLPGQVLLDRHRPTRHGHGRGLTRRPRPDRLLGQATKGQAPAGQLHAAPAHQAGGPLSALRGPPTRRRPATTIPARLGAMVATGHPQGDRRGLPRPPRATRPTGQ